MGESCRIGAVTGDGRESANNVTRVVLETPLATADSDLVLIPALALLFTTSLRRDIRPNLCYGRCKYHRSA
jgi:hypothetical protein